MFEVLAFVVLFVAVFELWLRSIRQRRAIRSLTRRVFDLENPPRVPVSFKYTIGPEEDE